MGPHFFVLLLIALSFLFTNADGRVIQDAGKQPGITLESDTHAKWTKLVSLLNPAHITDKIQEAPFVSNLFGIPLAANSGSVQPEAGAPPSSPGGGSELLLESLVALLSEEIAKIIRSFETMVNSTAALDLAFRDVIESASFDGAQSSNAPFTPLLKKATMLAVTARDDFRVRFPFPVTAPGHAERVKSVSEALEHFQRLVIRLARNHEIKQEVIERHLARVRPFLHEVGVFIGDVAELYPAAIEALVLNLSAVILPEAVFLRSLVILCCLGPYVLGRDAIGGWLLKHVSESLRV